MHPAVVTTAATNQALKLASHLTSSMPSSCAEVILKQSIFREKTDTLKKAVYVATASMLLKNAVYEELSVPCPDVVDVTSKIIGSVTIRAGVRALCWNQSVNFQQVPQ